MPTTFTFSSAGKSCIATCISPAYLPYNSLSIVMLPFFLTIAFIGCKITLCSSRDSTDRMTSRAGSSLFVCTCSTIFNTSLFSINGSYRNGIIPLLALAISCTLSTRPLISPINTLSTPQPCTSSKYASSGLI